MCLLVTFNGLNGNKKIIADGNQDNSQFISQLEIKLLKDTPAFQFVEGKRYVVATLLKSTVYQLLGEDEAYYQLSYGNDKIYIGKDSVIKRSTDAVLKPIKSEHTVLTESFVEVFETGEPSANIVARIHPNMRVVVLDVSESYYRIQIGGKDRFIRKEGTVEDSGLPVLMYHHMIENAAYSGQHTNRMVIDVRQFEEQMDFLVENGWTAISMTTFQQWKEKVIDLPAKVVLITFDDGILSTVKYAYPILKERNMPAVSFLITGKIRQEADQWDPKTLQNIGLKEIKATSDVYDYQHHAHYFHLFKKGTTDGLMITESYEAIMQDLEDGKHQMAKAYEGNTERVISLAYPFGHYNETTLRAVKDSGINYAFTTNPGNVTLGDPPLELSRQGIAPEHSLADFEAKLKNTFEQ